MSSSDIEDSVNCFDYAYRNIEPSTEKASRLVHAASTNNVDVLKQLLDSPKWYNTNDNDGLSLLQITIQTRSKEAFDYLLSLPDLNIDYVNSRGFTALHLASHSKHLTIFASELIRKGASTDIECPTDGTLLHCAINSIRPRNGEVYDFILKLLEAGAETNITHFEASVKRYFPPWLQEILFLYTFDKYTTIEFETLVQLSDDRSPLFDEIVKYSDNVIVNPHKSYDLNLLDLDHLEIIVEKYGTEVKKILDEHGPRFWLHLFRNRIRVECLDVLMESELKDDIISVINAQIIGCIYDEKLWITCFNNHPTIIVNMYLYLLSYGMVLSEWDLQYLYKLIGNTEFFRIFLHMDIKWIFLMTVTLPIRRIFPVFLYDLDIDLEWFLGHSVFFLLESFDELFGYFAHPRLAEFRSTEEKPRMPCLVELARNAFRKYLVEEFQITNTRTFYTIIKHLPISNVYKKIITLETKLY